jgi:Tat protein secretion system quality control protein TatD with DNase activity
MKHNALYCPKTAKALLKSVPKDRLLVETNAPYIAPNGIRVNSPVYLAEVIEVGTSETVKNEYLVGRKIVRKKLK